MPPSPPAPTRVCALRFSYRGGSPVSRLLLSSLLCLAPLTGACGPTTGGAGSSSSGGGSEFVSVITGDGETLEIRRNVDIRTSQRVSVTPAEAWAVLPGVYGLLEIELDTRVDAQRRLGASNHRFSRQVLGRRASDFFECGTDPGLNRPLADQSPIQAQVFTQVVPTANGTELRTTVQGSARRTGGAPGVANCESRGLLEVVIARLVQDLVNASR